MKYRELCDSCGHVATAYMVSLNTDWLNAFIAMMEFYLTKKRMVNINQELGLSHDQISNFNKLQHFGLVKKSGKDGFWLPTEFGIRFFRAEVPVLSCVAEIEGKVLPSNHEYWKKRRKQPVPLFIYEIKDSNYKRRPEYQAEKSGQTTLYDY